MSQSSSLSSNADPVSKPVPAWIASGVLGLVLGAGGALLGMQFVAPDLLGGKTVAEASAAAPAGGIPGMPAGMPGLGLGGRGGGGKRALTSLVGKLELLSRPDLKLYVDLDADQAAAVAAKLIEFEKLDTMTAGEAEANVESLEALLTPEQQEVVNAIGLPFGRGGGRGAGAAPGAGAPPPGGMMGMGGGDPNENPFTQEANQKRLRDLLARIAPDSAEGSDQLR